ncbi:MAG TPA: hypothetical protein PKI61_01640 [bacterium]|nr:hypothetical protein [bacterium]HPT30168.1 hypothetical protein [bacterium]
MYNWLSIVLILLSLIVIFALAIRKFPQLAVLDVENMPQEKEEKKKKEIIQKRLERDVDEMTTGFKKFFHKLSGNFNFFHRWLERLKAMQEKHREEKQMAQVSQSEKKEILIRQAQELAKQEDNDSWLEAEKKLIAVVEMDQKNLPAFLELGDLYLRLKKYAEAKQTFLYTLRLLEINEDPRQEAEVNYLLAQANENLDNLDEALANVIESLRIEPSNPRFLDFMLEICLAKKDREMAQETLKRLAEVNPENQKLADFQTRIDEIV